VIGRTKHFLKAAAFAVIVIAATAYIVNDIRGSKLERLFYGDIDLLHDGDVVSLAQMGGFSRYQAACAFTPNAADYQRATAADLKRFFGAIDYSAWQEDILGNFADGFSHGPVYYMIRDGAVVNALPAGSHYFSYVGLYFQPDASFALGCVAAGAICVQKTTLGGAQTVLLRRCLIQP
jgi:hypothetical protein